MNGVIFNETLRRGWRSALYWAIGLAFYAVYVLMVFGSDDATRAQMADLMATKLPGFMGAMFGIPDDVNFLMSNEGFLSFGYFTYISLMLSVWAVLAGLNITANDEESGVMNMLLSQPVPRWRVVAERLAAQLVLLAVIVSGGVVGIMIATQLNPTVTIGLGTAIAGSIGLWQVVAVVLAVTTVLAALFKRRGMAGAVAGGFVAASFLLNTLGAASGSSIGNALRNVSVFYHFDSADVLQNGLALGSVSVLVMAFLALSYGAVKLFERRDIGG